MKNKIFNILIVFTLVITGTIGATGMGVSANDPFIQDFEVPTPVSPGYNEINRQNLAPLGALTDEEIEKLWEQINAENGPDKGITGWVYNASVTNTWTGYTWKGWQVSGDPGGTVTLSQSFSISNCWGASIEFSALFLSATVGYDVTYSSTSLASYSHYVTPPMVGFIGYADFYDYTVHDLDVSATYYDDGVPTDYESGTAMTFAWTRFGYAYDETTSHLILPPIPSW